jgi:hypothetical protein
MNPVAAVTRGGVVAVLWIAIGSVGASGQLNQRQLQKFQEQQMRRMIRDALGPAAAVAPDPTAADPMSGALLGHGVQVVEGMKAAQRQLEAQRRSGKSIPTEALESALPPAIEDYVQVFLEKTGPGEGAAPAASARNAAARVSATYENAAGQRVVVDLMDIGLYMDMIPEDARPEFGEPVPEASTEDTIVGERKMHGLTAKVYYDRFNESGTLFLKANRVTVNIQGRNIPFAMLETSAAAIKVDELAKLGGSTP